MITRLTRRVPLKAISIVIAWGVVFGWMGLIFYVSQRPSVAETATSIPAIGFLPRWTLQWIYHGSVFAGLSILTYFALRLTFPLPWYLIGIAAFLISVGYGATDEWHQSFVRGREADVGDIVRDAIGAFFIIVLAHVSAPVADKLAHGLWRRVGAWWVEPPKML